MRKLQKRENVYYYRRRIPSSILHLSNMKSINRPLGTDKNLANKLAARYDHLFNVIVSGLKLSIDVNNYIIELGLNNVQTDTYQQYLDSQDVGADRLKKVARILEVIRALPSVPQLPKYIIKLIVPLRL